MKRALITGIGRGDGRIDDAALRGYREVLHDLLARREANKGELSREIEDQFTDELDRLWRAMTPAQRQALENDHSRRSS